MVSAKVMTFGVLCCNKQEVQDISRVSQQDKISLQKAVEAQLSAQVAAEHAKERANRQVSCSTAGCSAVSQHGISYRSCCCYSTNPKV